MKTKTIVLWQLIITCLVLTTFYVIMNVQRGHHFFFSSLFIGLLVFGAGLLASRYFNRTVVFCLTASVLLVGLLAVFFVGTDFSCSASDFQQTGPVVANVSFPASVIQQIKQDSLLVSFSLIFMLCIVLAIAFLSVAAGSRLLFETNTERTEQLNFDNDQGWAHIAFQMIILSGSMIGMMY